MSKPRPGTCEARVRVVDILRSLRPRRRPCGRPATLQVLRDEGHTIVTWSCEEHRLFDPTAEKE